MADRKQVVALVNKTKAARFVEIGVWKGDLTEMVLAGTNVAKVWAIDPWRADLNSFEYRGEDLPPKMRALGRYQCTMGESLVRDEDGIEELYHGVIKRLSKFGSRCQIIRETSREAVRRFKPESIDFVFIDAIHLYRYVVEDIRLWLPIVKPGGVLSGDDYWPAFPGVIRAVDELVPGQKVIGNFWYWVKK